MHKAIKIPLAAFGTLAVLFALAVLVMSARPFVDMPPGITVPEWYITGAYASIRTSYDKFMTGMWWPLVWWMQLALTWLAIPAAAIAVVLVIRKRKAGGKGKHAENRT